MNPMIHIAIENIGNEGMFGMFKENINRINAEVSFDQRKGADKKRKMHPIITIKNLALPAFAVEKNGMNMAGNAITIGNVEIKKEPLHEKRQQISVKNFSLTKKKEDKNK